MKSKLFVLLAFCFLTFAGCKRQEPLPERQGSIASIFKKKKNSNSDNYDLANILKSGELIIATISEPETYYDYHGVGMGFHYALTENFAQQQGLTVRVEVVPDTAALVKKLRDGEADLIAYPLTEEFVKKAGLVPTGYNKNGHWAVRINSTELASALDDWYGEGVEVDATKAMQERAQQSSHIERRAQAVYLSRDRGVISVYDNLFKQASTATGWDWRLIAAQCYQESAFDPNARSYVGAQGLMQIMPKTAASLGLKPEEVFMPEKNISAAANYISQLERQFSDVRSRDERVKFVLASYNGGSGHVRDAMNLAKKYGHNPLVWSEVAPYILALSQPKYYKDPVVRYGYMIGKETAGYVQKIMERYRDYGGNVVVSSAPQLPPDATVKSPTGPNTQGTNPAPQSEVSRRMNQTSPPSQASRNRYSSGIKVMRPDNPRLNQMNE